MKRLLHVIADYTPNSQEFGEILQRIWTQNWDLDLALVPTCVPPMDTIGTGFLTYQLALGLNPPETVLYINTAPRKEHRTAMPHNAGERLVWAKVATLPGASTSSVELVAVNSGFSLSLVRDHITELRAVDVPNAGSQFRSRDFFPAVVADVLHNRHTTRLLEEIDPGTIPTMPPAAVMWTDGFGNIKTTIRKSASAALWHEGSKVHIQIGAARATALVTGAGFAVDEGELAWSVGSSGHDDPFMEIFLRGGNAAALFGHPHAGIEVVLTR